MMVGNPRLTPASNKEQDAPVDFSVLDAAMTKRETRYEYYLNAHFDDSVTKTTAILTVAAAHAERRIDHVDRERFLTKE